MGHIMLATSNEYTYFSKDFKPEHQKWGPPTPILHMPQITNKAPITFDPEAEGLIREDIWMDRG